MADVSQTYDLSIFDTPALGPVSQKILSLEMDLSSLSSLITFATIVCYMLKITRGFFEKQAPVLLAHPTTDTHTQDILL